VRGIAGFCIRFLLIVPLCLVLWWWFLPAYVWCLGHLVGLAVGPFLKGSITAITVARGGLLNTGTVLNFDVNGVTKGIPVAALVSNVAPFVALVLATAKMRVRQRCATLGIGVAILAAGHAAYLALALVFAPQIRQTPDLPTALAQLFLTLPFLLWIVLAYWRNVVDLAGTRRGSAPDS
jgi:hypothetical protein